MADELVKPDPAALLAAALEYAGRGWATFPCLPGRKEPAVTHGFKDATIDPEIIRRWWRRWPTANVAIATGAPAVDVFDVDRKEAGNGYAALNAVKRAGMLDGTLALVQTRAGGLHVYLPGTDQPCGSIPHRFVDFKARGGYILCPPSVVDGRPYVRIEERSGTGKPLDWSAVRQLLDPPRSVPLPRHRPTRGSSAAALAAWLSTVVEGNRNAGLFWAACRLAEEDADATAFDELAAAGLGIGLTERETERTIRSAINRVRRGAA